MQQSLTTETTMEVLRRISWRAVNRNYSGVIVGKLFRRRDNAFIGYVVRLDNGKYSIVDTKSIINETAKTTDKTPAGPGV